MTKLLQRALDLELHRHERVIAELANLRMNDLVKTWGKKRHLKIVFGMGSEYIEVNHKHVFSDEFPLIMQAIKDIWDITNQYQAACPNDVEINERSSPCLTPQSAFHIRLAAKERLLPCVLPCLKKG